MNFNTVLLMLVLAALCFSIVQQPEKEVVQVQNRTVDVQEVNRTIVKEQPEPNITVTDGYRHIQNAEYKTDPEIFGNRLNMEEIDSLMPVYGSSMAPGIMQGDKLILSSFDDQNLETGQIIVFEQDENTIVHRIVGDYERDGFVLTRGDSNDYSEKVNVSEINYVVKGVVYG